MHEQIRANNLKTCYIFIILFLVFSAPAVALAYFYEWYAGLILFVVVFGYVLFRYFTALRSVIRLTGAQPISRQSHREVYLLVENLSLTVGLPTPDIYLVHDPALNAFAAGFKPSASIIGVTSGLLEALNKQELEAVLAHEMSHIKNRDTRVGTLVFAFVAGSMLMLHLSTRAALNVRHSRNNGAAIIAMFAISLIALAMAVLLNKAISRQREYLADVSGVEMTRYAEGMISALKKISGGSGHLRGG